MKPCPKLNLLRSVFDLTHEIFVKERSGAIAKTFTQLPTEQAGGDHAEQVHPVRPAVPPGHHQPAQDEHRRGEDGIEQ